MTNGFLNLFGVGYRYGFDADDGGHEAFVDWGTKTRGNAGFFLRQSPNREKPTYGFSLNSPVVKEHVLEAVYVSQGDRAWRASIVKHAVFICPGRRRLSRPNYLRQKEEDILLKKSFARVPSRLKFTLGEKLFPLFPVLAKPYLTAGWLRLLSAYHPQLTCEAGLGTELLLFGLYPRSFSVGARLDHEHKVHLKVELSY